ncbi:glycosyltransferase, partial [Pseudoxanthomonas sp. SGD-10]
MLISIITSTYNSKDYFPEALASYKEQSYTDKELIVVDGGSTDGTLAQIEAETETETIDQYISEPDKGIYDAL